MSTDERLQWKSTVREMFDRAPPPLCFYSLAHTALLTLICPFADVYGGYKQYAFPHDELRPISKSGSDSLVELGAAAPTRAGYSGVALTLIDSLDTLAMMGNASEFAWAVKWVGEHVSFDLDVEVSLFETNIRVLGGLLSAHLIAGGTLRGAEGWPDLASMKRE